MLSLCSELNKAREGVRLGNWLFDTEYFLRYEGTLHLLELLCNLMISTPCWGGKKQKQAAAQVVQQRGKTKATKQDQLQRWRIQWGIFIHQRHQPLNIYSQVWLGLCPLSSELETCQNKLKVTVTHKRKSQVGLHTVAFFKLSTYIIIVLDLEDLKALVTLLAHILCNFHILPPIVSHLTNPENLPFSIVLNFIFSPFSFLGHSFNILALSSEASCRENHRLFQGSGHCLSTPLCRKQLCIPP